MLTNTLCPYCQAKTLIFENARFSAFFCPSCFHSYKKDYIHDCCTSPKYEAKLGKQSNGRPLPKQQCKNCGCIKGVQGVKKEQCKGEINAKAHEAWYFNFEKERDELSSYLNFVDAWLNKNGFDTYGRYRHYIKNSVCWQEKRKLALERDGYKCTVCASSYNLQIHHKTYKNLFNEPLGDLQTLCKICHEKEHNQQKRYE